MSSHNMKIDYTMDDFHAEMRRRNARGKALKRPPRPLKKGPQELTLPSKHDHAPRITQNCTRIVGCACGWRTPPGVTDSEAAFVQHATVMR